MSINNSESIRPHLVVIGDANLDIISDLRKLNIDDFAQSNIDYLNGFGGVQVDVNTIAGGGGLLFASTAQKTGFNATLITSLGYITEGEIDIAGNVVLQSLKQAGIKSIYAKKVNEQTGKILIVYLPNKRRMIISNRGANAKFNLQDITAEIYEEVMLADMLHVSGYCLLEPNQRAATMSLVFLAKEHGGFTSLDVVPHKLYHFFTYHEFLEISRVFDIITIDLSTALRFMGYHISTFPELTIDANHPVVVEFLQNNKCLILRSNTDIQTVFTARLSVTEITGWSEVVNEEGFSGVAKATGYLDKLLAGTLYNIWNNKVLINDK